MTHADRAFLISETEALVNDLSSAAHRQTIRAEHIALTAAATRAQRIMIMLQKHTADPDVQIPV
jgi:capsule polysaccharide export protein KpsE/RkpR